MGLAFLRSKRFVTFIVSALGIFFTQILSLTPESAELLTNAVLFLGSFAIGAFTLEDVARTFRGTKNYPEFEAALKNAKKEMLETFTEFLKDMREKSGGE